MGQQRVEPLVYRTFSLDWNQLEAHLNAIAGAGGVVSLPHPDGGYVRFQVVERSNMHPDLAARYPEIRSFKGQGLDDPTAVLALDLAPKGLSAMWRAAGETVMMDPFQAQDREHVILYHRTDVASEPEFTCHLKDGTSGPDLGVSPTGAELLTFRVAIAATGEYTQYHGALGPSDPVTDTLAELNTALNRVNMIYETDAAIHMELIPNNMDIIYSNAVTDPYTNDNISLMVVENQSNLDLVIGSANYDIGHVFGTNGGGLVSGLACLGSVKARGATGISNPIGDPFYVDYVAHEMGHQWGANHTFNSVTSSCGGGNRNGSTAYEPGSASTIMGYAGICGSENLQPNSDPYFHHVSFQEIVTFSRSIACDVTTPTGNTPPDSVDAGMAHTIPALTPFILQGSANDGDGDTLTYCFEQYDLGSASPPMSDNGNRPIFRSFNPTLEPFRIVPKLSDILNQTSTIGENMATTDRILTFRLTVRDNAADGGGVDFDQVVLTVENDAGPFDVTSQSAPAAFNGGDMINVTWDVANTDAAPVSCANVDIQLSVDGGLTFTEDLLLGTPNDGSQMVTLTNVDAAQARIRVMCSDNIFFNINTANFSIASVAALCPTNFALWGQPTPAGFQDPLTNGVVDVADLVDCLFP